MQRGAVLAGKRTGLARALGIALALAAACSTLPTPTFPPFVDHHVETTFTVPADGCLQLPQSNPELTVWSLELKPWPERESVSSDGRRWFHYEPQTVVTVRCRCRIYGTADAPPRPIEAFFPGARQAPERDPEQDG